MEDGPGVAAELGARLLELELADPADWEAAAGSPTGFLALTLARWIVAAGGDGIEHLGIDVHLVDGMDRFAYDDGLEPNLDRMWLALETTWYNRVIMRHVCAMFEPVHPRLPATLYRILVGATSLVADVWDASYARDMVDMSPDYWVEEEALQGDEDVPVMDGDDLEEWAKRQVARLVLPALHRPSLHSRTLRRLATTLEPRRRRILEIALELQDQMAAMSEIAAALPAEARDDADYDWQPAGPALVVVMDAGDLIERTWDMENESRAQMGEPFAPAWARRFDARDDGSVRAAHRDLTAAVRTLRLASDLVGLLPTHDPAALVEVLVEVPV